RGPIADLLKGAGHDGQGVEGEIAVHYGGPVEPRLGFVVHSADYMGPGTERVGERFAMTAEPAVLRAIGQGNGPKKRFFAFGYCGWAPDQLEGELKRNDWVTVPADDSLVFGENLDEVWKRAFERRGFDL
ncbi:MAG: YqgE/AlgH family protein, partial [Alphaproteobacteria bacterium]